MSERRQPREPVVYRFQVKGHLDERWSDWFDGLAITRQADGETRLEGPVVDQPALHGILAKIRDLGLTLLSVQQKQPDPNYGKDKE